MMSPEIAALLGVVTLIFAFAPAIAISLAPPREKATGALRLLCGVAFTVLVMRVGAWPFASVHLSNFAGGAFFIGSIISMARAQRATSGERGMPYLWGAIAAVLIGLVGWAYSASYYRATPIDLKAVPLGRGTYAILQGGSSKLTNPFHGKLEELAAVDLVKLADSGNRATRFVPQALGDYASFGAPVLSPCDGEIFAAEGGDPDVPPGTNDERRGNYVVVRCEAGLVKLGHLQNGSVRARAGARVRTGQELARIGNSGGTSEPHLHIGAYALGTPLDRVLPASGDAPVTFGGHVLVANTVFTID